MLSHSLFRICPVALATGCMLSVQASEEPATLDAVRVVGRASWVPVEADDSYQPLPDASTLRSMVPVLETPQVVNVVPAQVVRDQQPRNLDDALGNVSGITQGNTLAGTQDTLMKRGFGGNRDGSIMHNGMPLVQGRGLNAAAESVEVLKGPSSMLYGIMDPGGVVNVVSKKPQLERRTALTLGGLAYAGGKNGGKLTLDTTGPLGEDGLAWRLVAEHDNEDYWRNFGRQRDTLIAPSLAWYGEATQAVLWYEWRDYLAPFDRGTALDPRSMRPLDIPRTRRLDEPFNERRGQTHLGQLSIDHRLGNGWAAHLNASYNRETYDAGQIRVNKVDPVTGILGRSNDGTRGALSTDSYGQAYIDGSLQWGRIRHDVQWGADAEYRKYYRPDMLRQATTATFNYLEPIYGLEAPSATVSANDSDQSDKLHNHAFFVQNNIHLGDKWIVAAGLRWQSWTQLAGRGRPFKTNTDIHGHKWLPRLGLIYRLDKHWSLYGNYARSLRPASTIAPSAGGVIDSEVAPEQGTSWEAGAKFDFPARVTGSIALFDIKKRHVLVQQYNDVTKQTDRHTSGAARSRGLEVDMAGQLSRQWSGIASFAWMDAKTTQDPLYAGKRLWNAARTTASLSAVYDAGAVFGGQERLRLGAGMQYVGRRAGDSANRFWLPGHTVAHAFATYDTQVAGYTTRWQLNIKNLFDRTYYPSGTNIYFVALGEARQVALSARMEF